MLYMYERKKKEEEESEALSIGNILYWYWYIHMQKTYTIIFYALFYIIKWGWNCEVCFKGLAYSAAFGRVLEIYTLGQGAGMAYYLME